MFSNDIPKSNKSYTDFLKNPVDDILGMGAQLIPKNSSGIDKKKSEQVLPSIVNPVKHIFNLSFQTGYIPLELMSFSSCTQIGFWYLFNNYRPIG